LNTGATSTDPFRFANYSFFNNPTNPYFDVTVNGANATGQSYIETGSFTQHWYMVDGATRPFLRAEHSTNIQNLHQLQLVDMNATANYTLARNLDASRELGSGMWRNSAFAPIAPVTWTDNPISTNLVVNGQTTNVILEAIANSQPTPVNFTGSFDGQGHTISNLVATSYGNTGAGLFGTIGAGGIVTNLGLINGRYSNLPSRDSNGAITAWQGYAGAIAGSNYGTISNSYATSNRSDTGVYTLNIGGGLVGYNGATGTVTQSYSSTGVCACITDALGYQAATLATPGAYGGLVGYNDGVISNTYASGPVSGANAVGGLVGWNQNRVTNSYTTGTISSVNGQAISYLGPVMGINLGTASNLYYDSTRLNNIASNGIGIGRTTAQMQDLSSYATNFAGFDFQNVWAPPNQAGQGGLNAAYYPELYSVSHVAVIRANDSTSVYGNAANLSATVTGLRSYDPTSTVSYSLSTTATANSGVGSYAVNISTPYLQATFNGATPLLYATAIGDVMAETIGPTPDLNGPGSGSGLIINGNHIVFQHACTCDNSVSRDSIINAINNGAGGVRATLDATGRLVLTYDGDINIVSTGYNNVRDGNVVRVSGNTGGNVTGLHNSVQAAANAPASRDGSGYRVLTLPSSGTHTVTPRALTVTAVGGSSTYGDTPQNAPGLQVTGLVNGDTLSGLSNSFNITNTTNAGTYGLTVNGTFNNANYNVTTQGGTWTVNRANLTVTANGGSSTYGDPTRPNPGLIVTGLRNNDSLGTLANSFDITNLTNAGTYGLTVSGALNNANYNLTTQGANWTVNRANLTVAANGGSSTYGDPTRANPGLTVTGLRNNDSLGTLANSFDITNLTNAGTHGLTVTGALNNANYNLTAQGANWTVNRADLTVAANGGSSTYGDPTRANPGLTVTGLRNNDSLGTLANSFNITNLTNAGTYGLTVDGALNNANYNLTTQGANWTVNRAVIDVSANGGRSTYGQSPLNPGISATGLRNNEDVSVLAGLSNTFGITSTTSRGTYGLSVAGDLAANSNYTIANRNAGSWTVDPASIIVTANGGRSTYGQSPANPGLSATGLQNGEGIGVLTGLSNSFGITGRSNAGGHALSVNGTLTNGNYVVTTRNSGVWTVDPAAITVTANGGRSVYGSQPGNPGLSATGLQNGEGVDVLTGLTNSFGITGRSHAGSTLLSVAGNLTNPNYNVTVRNNGVWTVTPASLTVTADPQSRLVGARDPALTYRITTGQLFNGDVFTGELARTGRELPGTYAIEQGTLALSRDYALSFVGSTFAIRAVPSDPTSRFIPTVGVNPALPANPTTISFQGPTMPPVTASLVAAPPTQAPIETLDPSVTSTTTRQPQGPVFLPISQYDPAQYAGRSLPAYAPRAGEAAVLTMIARALASEERDGIVIDTFWNAAGNDGQGTTMSSMLANRIAFSDGSGRLVSLEEASTFPFVAGATNMTDLLRRGPVIIVGATGQDGVRPWMLATGVTADGRGVLANDAVSGRRVVLAYDPVARTLGPVTGVVDARTGAIIPIADAEAVKLAGLDQFAPNGTSTLQSFVPQGYFAVSVK